MINLRVHTEFHFDYSDRGYGKLPDVVARIKALGQSAAAITDSTTFGHIAWHAECRRAGIKPLLGVTIRIPFAEDHTARVVLIARSNTGLAEMYGLASAAVSEELTLDALAGSSAAVLKLTGTLPLTIPLLKKIGAKRRAAWLADVSPGTAPELLDEKGRSGLKLLATSENRYPSREDKPAFSLFGGSVEGHPQHLLSGREARVFLKKLPDSAFTLSDRIAAECDEVVLPKAENMKVEGNLEKLCRDSIRRRLGRWTKRYEERLKLELKMIAEKKFESYFLIISDMVRYAKKHMIVGPARGSAAGSLVCYLADITDIDPLQHGLLFERFIDVTRADLPDIDLDFPDTKRELVIKYLRDKYGADHVIHLGTTLTLQPKSILNLVGKRLNIPKWELKPLSDAMIVRSSGDSRAALCLLDTLEGMDVGKAVLAKYPALGTATKFEGHANATGTHAAGIIVCSRPVREYCTVDSRSATAQLDKVDAEKINLLKIDVLGLRTLSVFEYCVEQLPKRIDLTRVPLDDARAFKLLNEGRWAGIFQFEGDAVQMLTKQMKIDAFSDIVALGALARPGPLNSGGASEWAERRMGRSPVEHLHPMCEEFTAETYGIVIYQEQVMSIGRKMGRLDWDDVTELRKAMSKSKGEEFFNRYWEKFLKGCLAQGVKRDAARHVWDHLNTMGSWSFNKSHAVSYGLISYWCAYLKAHFPLEFAAATLRHTKGEDQTINLLRELREEGIDFVPFDPMRSRENWQVIAGQLVGGFLNLKGIGVSGAAELVKARDNGGWTPKQRERIERAEVMYEDVFPANTRYSGLYEDPKRCGFRVPKIWTARELDAAKVADTLPEEFYFLGRLADKVPRDLNEYVFQVKRVQEGRPKLLSRDTAYLNLVLEDDTGRVYATVNNRFYEDVGKPIVNTGVVGRSWYVFRGRLNQIRRINITWAKDVTEESWS